MLQACGCRTQRMRPLCSGRRWKRKRRLRKSGCATVTCGGTAVGRHCVCCTVCCGVQCGLRCVLQCAMCAAVRVAVCSVCCSARAMRECGCMPNQILLAIFQNSHGRVWLLDQIRGSCHKFADLGREEPKLWLNASSYAFCILQCVLLCAMPCVVQRACAMSKWALLLVYVYICKCTYIFICV